MPNQIQSELWTKDKEDILQSLIMEKFRYSSQVGKGRPSKLIPEIIERFLQAARQGAPVSVCAAYAGLNGDTFYLWQKQFIEVRDRLERIERKIESAENKGEKYKLSKRDEEDLKINPQEQILIYFFSKLEEADAESVVRALVSINKAHINGQWTAAAWFLERKKPEYFAKREEQQVASTGSGFAYVEIASEQQVEAEKNITERANLLNEVNQESEAA